MSMQVSIAWFGDQVKHSVKTNAGIGLRRASEHVLTEANRTVPWDQGPLERSGNTDVDSGRLRSSIYYDTPYARRQHEEVTWRHPKKGRAKWLELTLREQAAVVNQIVAKAMKDALS